MWSSIEAYFAGKTSSFSICSEKKGRQSAGAALPFCTRKVDNGETIKVGILYLLPLSSKLSVKCNTKWPSSRKLSPIPVKPTGFPFFPGGGGDFKADSPALLRQVSRRVRALCYKLEDDILFSFPYLIVLLHFPWFLSIGKTDLRSRFRLRGVQ